jgi:biopolymer transport protein ExbD
MLLTVDDEFDDFVAPHRKGGDADSEMDITPMIDITFLLLIFFLVASTPDKNTAVDLPKAQHGDGVSQLHSVVFTLGEGGIDYAPAFNGDGKVPGTELPNDLEERASQIETEVQKGVQEGKTDVVIKADRNVKVRDIHRVMKAASKVQGIKLNLAVLETETD